MASIFGHGMVGFTIAKVSSREFSKTLIVLAIISSVIPDIDVIGYYTGVDYGSIFSHRGFTHSILFAVLWAISLSYFFSKKRKGLFFSVIFFSTLSHGVLDAMTTGGSGVGFFIPFVNERIFFPFRFIKVSPLGIERFFSSWGLQVIINELKYILIPCLIVLLLDYILNRARALTKF